MACYDLEERMADPGEPVSSRLDAPDCRGTGSQSAVSPYSKISLTLKIFA